MGVRYPFRWSMGTNLQLESLGHHRAEAWILHDLLDLGTRWLKIVNN
jgi:hypothetical protein